MFPSFYENLKEKREWAIFVVFEESLFEEFW